MKPHICSKCQKPTWRKRLCNECTPKQSKSREREEEKQDRERDGKNQSK